MSEPENVTRSDPVVYGDVASALASADSVVAGGVRMGSQYHFHMETHVCIVKPTDDGFDVDIPSQDINGTVISIAKVLKISVNRYWNASILFKTMFYGPRLLNINFGDFTVLCLKEILVQEYKI